ncbi:TetR/AcrR family transcriptional regulator [Streptomyces sp. NPDC127068]|uniref:TetR/AcrR family transcriptional regulator n=1 Tax=Streptomyces sp. NPDC127068 TaxID=3347127 RepID=UPI003659D293
MTERHGASTGVVRGTGAGGAGGSGRIDKRRAILDAAFVVFARRGYAGAGVKEIAAEAGVAKPTVYNHLTDKENLFRRAMEAAADAVAEENLAVLDRLRAPGDDLEAALDDVAFRLLKICRGERAGALRWLTHAQVAEFPDLVVAVQERTAVRVADALADRLARLALAGRLRTGDPAHAAEQLLSLLTGPLELRSRLGTRPLSTAETRAIAERAVRTFLRAHASGE